MLAGITSTYFFCVVGILPVLVERHAEYWYVAAAAGAAAAAAATTATTAAATTT